MTKNKNSVESFGRLIQIMRDDRVINEKVMELLQLDVYQRRIILNEWLEQLRIKEAPANLIGALSCLFDDEVAQQVLIFIKKHT